MFNGIVPGGTMDSFNPSGTPSSNADSGSLLNSLSSLVTTAAKTAASVKGLFSNKPAGSADVVGEVRFTVPQLGGMSSQTLLIGGALVVAVVLFVVLRK